MRVRLADPAARSATVDRFLDELDQMAPATALPTTSGASVRLRAASRAGFAVLTNEFDQAAGDFDEDALTALADELAAMVRLLIAESALAKHLARRAGTAASKLRLVDRLLSGKVGDLTVNLLRTSVRRRGTWR